MFSICGGKIWHAVKLGQQGRAKLKIQEAKKKKKGPKTLNKYVLNIFYEQETQLISGEVAKVCKFQSLSLMNLVKWKSQITAQTVKDT